MKLGVLFFVVGLGLVDSLIADDSAVRLDVTTTVDADGAYRTVGRMALPFPPGPVARQMTDFDHYAVWAPRGQDGQDPGSASYIGQLIGVRTRPGILDLIYRINMVWPFGSSGQAIPLAVQVTTGPDGSPTVHFALQEPSFVVPIFEGKFSLVPGEGMSEVELDCRLKMAWFLQPFFPLDAYRIHVVKRLETALRSFAADLVPVP